MYLSIYLSISLRRQSKIPKEKIVWIHIDGQSIDAWSAKSLHFPLPRSITKGWFRLCPFKRNNFWSCPTSVSVFHKLPEPCTYWNSGHTTRMQCAHTCLYVRVAGMFYVQNTRYCPDVCLSKFIQVYSFLSLSLYLSICPSVHLSIFPFVHLSIVAVLSRYQHDCRNMT